MLRVQWRARAPPLQQVFDCVHGLQYGIRDDRGRERKLSALGVPNSMNFCRAGQSLSVLQEHFATPLIKNLREASATICSANLIHYWKMAGEDYFISGSAASNSLGGALVLWHSEDGSKLNRDSRLAALEVFAGEQRAGRWACLGHVDVVESKEEIGADSSCRSIKGFGVQRQARLVPTTLKKANDSYNMPLRIFTVALWCTPVWTPARLTCLLCIH